MLYLANPIKFVQQFKVAVSFSLASGMLQTVCRLFKKNFYKSTNDITLISIKNPLKT